MRKGDVRDITVEGETFPATYLGKGRHATAWRRGDTVYLFCVEDECMKEALDWVPDGTPHVPAVARHGEVCRRGKFFNVYSMPYYPDVTARDVEAWRVLRTLRETADRIFRESYGWKKPLSLWGAYYFQDVIDATRGRVPESVTVALENLLDAGSNYGVGVAPEFGKRNIGVDPEGRIVFRDILFDAEKMGRELAEKRRQPIHY